MRLSSATALPIALCRFYTKEGMLTVDIFMFKSIMIVVGSITAAFLLVAHFKRIKEYDFREGVAVGITWLGINIGLDLIFLIPNMGIKMSVIKPRNVNNNTLHLKITSVQLPKLGL